MTITSITNKYSPLFFTNSAIFFLSSLFSLNIENISLYFSLFTLRIKIINKNTTKTIKINEYIYKYF